jgi:CHAD domain-containing protein/phosphohistidine phosphatase SixA
MPRKPTIGSLCAKYKNEDVHSQHVATLSLKLFDAVSSHLKLPMSLRPLLKAAALLHDIGYAENPQDHQAESAWLIVKKGIAGFTDEQCGTVAAATLLHRKDYSKAFSFPLFRDIETKETALALGAILRIADGLDHGHMQNTGIVSVRQAGGGFACVCASPGYAGNRAWAQGKADLFKRVFSRDFSITETSGDPQGQKYAGIVRQNDTVLDAARRLMFLQYRIITENHGAMLEGKSEDPLHDVRVAIRRFRAALRLFGGFLPLSSCRAIDNGLSRLALLLSPLRDNDVWMGFLSQQRLAKQFAGNIEFVHFCAMQSRMKKKDRQATRGILTSNEYASLQQTIVHFLRIELSEKIKKSPPIALAPFAGRRICALYYEALARPGVKKEYEVKKMHSLRKLCRRGRYWSEFCMPALGEHAAFMAARFKDLADGLGDLHDSDMALRRISPTVSFVTQKLSDLLLSNKRKQLALCRRLWRSLRSPGLHSAAASLCAVEADNAAVLYLVRHAAAAKTQAGRLRGLSKKGAAQARAVSQALWLLQCRPRAIAASPLARAVDTAEFIAQSLQFPSPLLGKKCLLPDADPEAALSWLVRSHLPSCVCVGHLPQLALLARALLPANQGPVDFKKASVCCISFNGRIEPGRGMLQWYFTSKQLKRIVNRMTGAH